MADVDHPKTHVENQKDVDLPRTQPESPKHEGIDPLTETDTMYPAEDTRADSEKLSEEQANQVPEADPSDPAAQVPEEEPSDDVNSGVPQESTDNVKKDGSGEAGTVNADGKLPDDAKVANHVGSDRGNTSPSNKPATQDEPTSPDESNSVTADKTTKATGAKAAEPKADPSVRPTNNLPKSELK